MEASSVRDHVEKVLDLLPLPAAVRGHLVEGDELFEVALQRPVKVLPRARKAVALVWIDLKTGRQN